MVTNGVQITWSKSGKTEMTYDTKSKIAVYGLPTLERGNLLFSIFFPLNSEVVVKFEIRQCGRY